MAKPLVGRVSLTKACRLIPLSWPTAKKYVEEGKLRGIKIGGRWMVDLAEVDRFRREGNYVEPTEQDAVADYAKANKAVTKSTAFPSYLRHFSDEDEDGY